MRVMPFLEACHACVLMLYCIVNIVCYVCGVANKVLSLSIYLSLSLHSLNIRITDELEKMFHFIFDYNYGNS